MRDPKSFPTVSINAHQVKKIEHLVALETKPAEPNILGVLVHAFDRMYKGDIVSVTRSFICASKNLTLYPNTNEWAKLMNTPSFQQTKRPLRTSQSTFSGCSEA